MSRNARITINSRVVATLKLDIRLACPSQLTICPGISRLNIQMGMSDITVSQTMLRHAKPDMTAVYTHGNFEKALDAQREYMEQLRRMKPASEATQ